MRWCVLGSTLACSRNEGHSASHVPLSGGAVVSSEGDEPSELQRIAAGVRALAQLNPPVLECTEPQPGWLKPANAQHDTMRQHRVAQSED